jgi:peroxiredoxin
VTLLRDPELAVAAAWGVRVGDEDAPWPAVFVIGRDGAIRYRHLRDTHGDWPAYDDVAAALTR